MELNKNVEVISYEVLANYKVKVENSPYIAILKLALENNNILNISYLHSFLKPLLKKACANILKELTQWGYFEEEEIGYVLTELGINSAIEKTFYKSKYGILNVSILKRDRRYWRDNDDELEIIKTNIVRIEEKDLEEWEKEKREVDVSSTELFDSLNTKFELSTGSYFIDEIKPKGSCFGAKTEKLTLSVKDKLHVFNLLDYEQKGIDGKKQLYHEMIVSEFGQENYNLEKSEIRVHFNKEYLDFNQDRYIKPCVLGVKFDQFLLQGLRFFPKNLEQASLWYKALVIHRIQEYFLSEEQFSNFTNQMTICFDEYSKDLKNTIKRGDLIYELLPKYMRSSDFNPYSFRYSRYSDEDNEFYKRMKLEAMDDLNYKK